MSGFGETEKKYEEAARARRVRNLSFAAKGVLFTDIDSAYIDENVIIGAGSRIGPCVTIRGTAVIGADCVIGQNSEIENCVIGDGVRVIQSVLKDSAVGKGSAIGPFAYLRPGSAVGDFVKIGDFVEVKNANIGDGTKVSHLSYVGDADLGPGVNIGCGVVFVNYDGREKRRSTVGGGAFVGCNVNIIAPVSIGEKAYIAAGTTVTRDVPGGSLCVSREKAKIFDGWVERRGLLAGRIKAFGEIEKEQRP
ncbi:MAG: UDP-N-acetylglucosamine diphosphorylase [Clostridiales Family XIII bacterium]|jgi:bifunctional UDP-N-acetylglucosamine pyrophosphorylase/glucosamine-1-phosphate N-acetyltransferase|nr:UDP-N-acetylglucosamine diphosphorylase [Clostridiales Family XIII bacterium]